MYDVKCKLKGHFLTYNVLVCKMETKKTFSHLYSFGVYDVYPKRVFLTYNVLECIVPHSCSPSFANLAESWNGSLAKK